LLAEKTNIVIENNKLILDDQFLAEKTNIIIEKHTHKPGEVVEVLPRTWPGVNKPGGTIRIYLYSTCELI
jgi:hypothetical protein